MTDRHATAADRLLAVVLFLGAAAVLHRAASMTPESDNTIAYSLPAANLVARGRLSVPQLGTQFGLDRFWLLNSPLMGLGQVPFFATLGVNHEADVAGVLALALVNVVVFAGAIRGALGLRFWSPAVLLSAAFLGNRLVMTEVYLQRYSVVAFGLMTLAFLPDGRGGRAWPPWWQWLAVGLLPLAHPALIPAWGFWLVCEAARVGGGRFGGGERRAEFSRAGVALVAGCAAMAVAWYGRLDALRAQFLPHLRYGNFRKGAHLTGLLKVPAGRPFDLPSLATHLACVGLAWGLLVAFAVPSRRARLRRVLVPAGVVALISLLDLARGFGYGSFYYVGVGPCLLFAFPGGRPRRLALAALAALAAGHLAVASRLDGQPPAPWTSAQARAFLVEHTRPSDRIVAGTPFILPAAGPALPGGRRVVYVVPNPYFLDGMDEAKFRREIRSGSDVYVGEEAWYTKQLGFHVAETGKRPLFPGAEVRRFALAGRPMVVVRKGEGPGG